VETMVARTLHALSSNLTLDVDEDIRVVRRDSKGPQTLVGACMSALYGCAFQVQAAVARIAGNHRIQATGAELCKLLQVRLWDLQPRGIHPWRVSLFQVHDEVNVVHVPELTGEIRRIKDDFVAEYRSRIPELRIEWKSEIGSWAEKG